MPLKKHQKAIKFSPVTGGNQLVFKHGWANGIVAVPTIFVGTRVFVFADLSSGSGFGQLVFGRKKSTKEERAQVRCIGQIQMELRRAVDAEESETTFSSASAEVAQEEDPMADALCARAIAVVKRRKLTRSEYRSRAQKKKVMHAMPLEQRQVSVRFPKRPEQAFDNDASVNVLCLCDISKQRLKGVWVDKEVFPWLVIFAAEEVAKASGQVFCSGDSPGEASAQSPQLAYSVGASSWELRWIDPVSNVLQTLQKKVPHRRFSKEGIQIIPPLQFLALKEKMRLLLLREAEAKGFDNDLMGLPEISDVVVVATDMHKT